ncbi:hypothetical protein U1Q18_032304 [Sarracenia purpurea var. burkii]
MGSLQLNNPTMAAACPTNQQVEYEIAAPSVDAYLGLANGGTTTYGGHNQHHLLDYPLGYPIRAAAFPRNQQLEEEIATPSVDAYLGSANGNTTTYGGHNQHYVHDYPSGHMIMAAPFPTNQQAEEEFVAPSVDAYIGSANGGTTTYGGHNQHYVHDYPSGYRFCPTDTELVVHYLTKKIKNEPLPHNKIPILNIYQYNPHDLAGLNIYQYNPYDLADFNYHHRSLKSKDFVGGCADFNYHNLSMVLLGGLQCSSWYGIYCYVELLVWWWFVTIGLVGVLVQLGVVWEGWGAGAVGCSLGAGAAGCCWVGVLGLVAWYWLGWVGCCLFGVGWGGWGVGVGVGAVGVGWGAVALGLGNGAFGLAVAVCISFGVW